MEREEDLISNLPNEVLECILSNNILDEVDVVNFRNASRNFETASCSQVVWKSKYLQKFKRLQDMPEICERLSQPLGATDWMQEFYNRKASYEQVSEFVSSMSPKYYKVDELSKSCFEDVKALIELSGLGQSYVLDSLLEIRDNGTECTNLTEKYYAEKILGFVQHYRLCILWIDMFRLPEEEQSLELGASYISQWCQPSKIVNSYNISVTLSNIASDVLIKLESLHPNHPILKSDHEIPIREPPLQKSLWKPSDCKSILECVNHVMFEDMKIRGECTYDSLVAEYSLIDRVLDEKIGIPIIMCVIYYSVCKRLGVKCELITFPCHFLLRFREFPNRPPDEEYTYIDACNGGIFLSESHCRHLAPAVRITKESFRVANARQVFERMTRNLVTIHEPIHQSQFSTESLIRVSLELLTFLAPDDRESMLHLFRLYMHHRINLDVVVQKLQTLPDVEHRGAISYMSQASQLISTAEEANRQQQILPKVRKSHPSSQPLRYAVGMIMRHRRYHYNCVIYGWDLKCAASKEWINQMRVHNLPHKDNQPFYNVMVADGSLRYAAQENLETPSEPIRITHESIGRYFEEYCGRYYKPNAELAQEYPEDQIVCNRLLNKK